MFAVIQAEKEETE